MISSLIVTILYAALTSVEHHLLQVCLSLFFTLALLLLFRLLAFLLATLAGGHCKILVLEFPLDAVLSVVRRDDEVDLISGGKHIKRQRKMKSGTGGKAST